jgi:hypothetical protein
VRRGAAVRRRDAVRQRRPAAFGGSGAAEVAGWAAFLLYVGAVFALRRALDRR